MFSASSPPPVGQEHCEGEDARDCSEDIVVVDENDWIDGAVLARDEVEEILQVGHTKTIILFMLPPLIRKRFNHKVSLAHNHYFWGQKLSLWFSFWFKYLFPEF